MPLNLFLRLVNHAVRSRASMICGIKFTVQIMGGAPANEVKELLDKGVSLIPVTCDDVEGTGFHHLYKNDKPMPEKGWINYYRSDDMASITWLYLEKNENPLPSILPLSERI